MNEKDEVYKIKVYTAFQIYDTTFITDFLSRGVILD